MRWFEYSSLRIYEYYEDYFSLQVLIFNKLSFKFVNKEKLLIDSFLCLSYIHVIWNYA